jgi:hypothetical protein
MKSALASFDFRAGKLPEWVQDAITTQLAIDAEDAKRAGQLGFMARALVLATMPYKDPKTDAFTRQNGDFRLRIVAGYEGGIPFGVYPRLLMSWVSTEAVRKQSPTVELGESLAAFLQDVMDIKGIGGGPRGSATRVAEQMKRLFGSLVTAQYNGSHVHRGFLLRNVLVAEELQLEDGQLWTPQARDEAGRWKSQVKLSAGFFQECVTNPVPIDLRAYKALRISPLAMDIYTWLTYRMSYTQRKTKPIRWEPLMMQFGSNYNTGDLSQDVRNFKKAFLRALKMVSVIYPEADVDATEIGLILNPSKPHVLSKQEPLF